MVDLYLEALMKGEIGRHQKISMIQPKNRFDAQIEKDVDSYLSTLSFEFEDPNNKFITPEIKRVKKRAQLLEEIKQPELFQQIDLGIKILISEGGNYLSNEENEVLSKEIFEAIQFFENMDLDQTEINYKEILNLSEVTINSIFKIAVDKFNESNNLQSYVLFLLLSIFIPENAQYWFRAGICAHKCENYDQAIRCYSAASALDPTLFEPWIFSIDCHLRRGRKLEAQAAYEEAINMNGLLSLDDSWKLILMHYQAVFTA
ncbi:MAG: tetratricopeptide repeat protein [Parachlamydiaceae bacterium]|nr:tetratricopeptide repeat protein [Parachlamydiaceae bacterium]